MKKKYHLIGEINEYVENSIYVQTVLKTKDQLEFLKVKKTEVDIYLASA